ncbi:MAG: class I SAM-dependent methyltransferase [Pirellulaceae bacterium]|nr:class I SAM-dependent methyltransferase [Pirellulaceae bacterium]
MLVPPFSPPLVSLQNEIARRNRQQVRAGQRFAFGENWQRFLACLDEARIGEAEASLREMLHVTDLRNRTFLDVGSGSGLFSLAAMRLGAARVHSFDFDPQCVACAQTLKQRFFPRADRWTIDCGDILSVEYLATVPQADIVYCWGMLHQTGQMWQALENTLRLVVPGGLVYLSIYNHQPLLTPCWIAVKRLYNRLPHGLRWPLVLGYLAVKTPLLMARDIVTNHGERRRASAGQRRGMSRFHDAADWIGGYPHQTAKPESVFRFVRDRGFVLTDLTTVGGGSGCNQFVFKRVESCGSCI